MPYLTTDRGGRYLLAASYQGSLVSVSPIAAKGGVGTTIDQKPTEPHAHCIVVDGSNRYALHTRLGGDVIEQDRFDAATGRLTANEPPMVRLPANSGPRHLVFSVDGGHVYVIDELDAKVHVFAYDGATGTLRREIQVASALPPRFTGKPWAADIHLTPDGSLLYASERAQRAATSVAPSAR